MKVRGSRLFPYPVLWFLNDDYVNDDNQSNPDFVVDIDFKYQFRQLAIEYEITLDDNELAKLIDKEEAICCMHIEAPLTSYRYTYLTNQAKGKIVIDENDINYTIEVSTFVVALEDIDNYQNSSLNKDYDDVEINMTKGSILAIGDYTSTTIDKSQNDLGKKDSILHIARKFDIDVMEFEIENDRIIVNLNEIDFENLQRLQMSSEYKNVIYSIIIVPALIYVFDSIAHSNNEELETLSEYKWFRSLEKILNSNGIDLNPQTIRTKTSYGMSQKIIGNPISKTLEFLNERGEQ